MKYKTILISTLAALLLAACSTNKPIESNGEIAVTSKVIYPKYRVWTTPSGGEEPAFNSPSFE